MLFDADDGDVDNGDRVQMRKVIRHTKGESM